MTKSYSISSVYPTREPFFHPAELLFSLRPLHDLSMTSPLLQKALVDCALLSLPHGSFSWSKVSRGDMHYCGERLGDHECWIMHELL
jgi:hypothetical protein